MLTTYLNNKPYSKCVLIQDNLERPGKKILKYIIDSHLKLLNCQIHYFVFEGNFTIAKKFISHPNLQYFDFVSDARGWLSENDQKDFCGTILKMKRTADVVVIDSLAHAIFYYGIATIYKTLLQLLNSKGLLRIVTVLHQDLCLNNLEILEYFEHLSTLSLSLEPPINSNNSTVSYVYKKTGGKVVKKVEEYKFLNDQLMCEEIKKIDAKTIIEQKTTTKTVVPENLSTFKIGLKETEKEIKAKLVLPFTLQEIESNRSIQGEEESNIVYNFDATDDWDEEDPDDDLDI